MKSFSWLIVVVLLSGCIAEREFVVDYDYSYHGKFRRYKTFNFMTTGDTVNFNGLSDMMVRDEIERRLESQGYRYSEHKPSMLIAYKVFDDDFVLNGYSQLELEYWNDIYGHLAEDEDNLANIKEAEYNTVEYSLQKGTLLIDFIDSKTHSVIWQGYASGLFDDSTFFSKDIKYAVRSILNQYRLLASSIKDS